VREASLTLVGLVAAIALLGLVGDVPVFLVVAPALLAPILAGFLVRRLILSVPPVSGETVLRAMGVYVLLGLMFALLFMLVPAMTGATFFEGPQGNRAGDYLYFSYVTLATIGYGDLVPRSSLARILSVIEALSGQLYLVTVIALLISRLDRRPD
jgi:hypothetical protein